MIPFLPPEASGTPFLWLGDMVFPPQGRLQPHRLDQQHDPSAMNASHFSSPFNTLLGGLG